MLIKIASVETRSYQANVTVKVFPRHNVNGPPDDLHRRAGGKFIHLSSPALEMCRPVNSVVVSPVVKGREWPAVGVI